MGAIAYTSTGSNKFTIEVFAVVIEDEYYSVYAIINPGGSSFLLSYYTALAGDTVSDVVNGLYANTNPAYRDGSSTSYYNVNLSALNGSIYSVGVVTPPSTTTGAPLLIPPSVPYGLIYLCTFDPLEGWFTDPAYRVEILQKNYDGDTVNVIGGNTVAIQNWQTDEPKAPVKGCSLKLTFVNDGSLPLESFISTDDDEFKVRLFYKTQLLFEGFLVQDDFSEVMIDSAHYIQLSANDNLGLLKSVSLNDSSIYSFFFEVNTFVAADMATDSMLLYGTIVSRLRAGDKVTISGGTVIDGTYTILSKVDDSSTGRIDLDSAIPADYTGTATLSFYERPSLLDKIPLLSVIEMCLSVTNLEMLTYVWASIREVTQNADSTFLKQTLIDPQTFLKDDTNYEDCYSVLTKILSRFNMTLFQSYGVWNLVRWDELRYYSNALTAFIYDLYGNDSGTAMLDAPILAGLGQQLQPEAGLQKRFIRPFVHVKETFNYKQPARLLRNFDLQNLGPLIRTYTTGSGFDLQTINEYEAMWWYYTDAFPSASGVNGPADYFIRVITDYYGTELDRSMIIKNNHIYSYIIDGNIGDYFTWSFSLKTPDKDWTGGRFVLIIKLTDGIKTRYAKDPAAPSQIEPGWGAGLGFSVDVGGNTQEGFVNFSITSQRLPFDGLLTFYLQTQSLVASDETLYKDIRLEYFYSINESTKIIGHTHEDQQYQNIKQNSEDEIYIDSSPRNSIAGTLFLDSKTGFLQNKATFWTAPYTTPKRLGNITTFEELFWRRITRKILDGSFYVTNSADLVSMLSVIQYPDLGGLNFVWGMLEINYKTKMVTGTLWEMWRDGEVDSDLAQGYDFTYLYSTK